jgi:hypothetical protein
MAGREAFRLFTEEARSRLFYSDQQGSTSGDPGTTIGEGSNKEEAMFNLVAGGLQNYFFKDSNKDSQSPSSPPPPPPPGGGGGIPGGYDSESQPQPQPMTTRQMEEEAYRLASEEAHSRLSGVIGGNPNHEAAFKLFSGEIGGALFKGKEGDGM